MATTRPPADVDDARRHRIQARRRLVTLSVLGVVALATAAVVVPRLRARGATLAVGSVAPGITLTGDDGVRVDVRARAGGGPYVVEFLETTCPTCQAEVPAVCRFAAGHPDIPVFGVDAALEDAAHLRAFRRDHGGGCMRFPLLVDPGDAVTHAYDVGAVPTVYLVGADGRVAYAGVGADGIAGLTAAARTVHG